MITRFCKKCNKETGPSVHFGCDQSQDKNCAWFVESFNKNKADELNDEKRERIKNNIEDGKDTFGI